MTSPGQRRDCTHQRVHHQHGTRLAYVADHCRCGPCTTANRAAGQARRKAITHGTWSPYRSGTTAARRIHQLITAGMTITAVATAAGVARSTVRGLYRSKTPGRIRVTTHVALLSVPAPPRRRTRRQHPTPPPPGATAQANG